MPQLDITNKELMDDIYNESVNVYTRFGYANVDLGQFRPKEEKIKQEDDAPAEAKASSLVEEDNQIPQGDKKLDSAEKIQEKLDLLTKKYENAQKKIVHVTLLKGGEGYIQRKELLTHIHIYVKVFHGKRETHFFRVSILDKIQVLIDKIKRLDEDEMKNYFQIRLVYPMGYLRNLSDVANQTFLEQQIPDNAKLVLVGRMSFQWDIN